MWLKFIIEIKSFILMNATWWSFLCVSFCWNKLEIFSQNFYSRTLEVMAYYCGITHRFYQIRYRSLTRLFLTWMYNIITNFLILKTYNSWRNSMNSWLLTLTCLRLFTTPTKQVHLLIFIRRQPSNRPGDPLKRPQARILIGWSRVESSLSIGTLFYGWHWFNLLGVLELWSTQEDLWMITNKIPEVYRYNRSPVSMYIILQSSATAQSSFIAF